jgi:hypothetical protein
MIGINYRHDFQRGEEIETYAKAFSHYMAKTHEVLEIGAGTDIPNVSAIDPSINLEWIIDLDAGRDTQGNFSFSLPDTPHKSKRAVWFIDSHGQPSLHHRLSAHYDAVFFAVWARRDLFAKHPNANWLPCCTDIRWFHPLYTGIPVIKYDWGFFGSRHGLDRAAELKTICERLGYTYDIREVARSFTHKWIHTGCAMAACRNLFNKGQKHDSPNQRVMESMLVGAPLLTNIDPVDGMNLLFTEGEHYIGYTDDTLEERVKWMVEHRGECATIAKAAQQRVIDRHTMDKRVAAMCEVLNVK